MPAALGSDLTMRVPPHNLDAEESLLGAMMLRTDAIGSAVEVVNASDFYKPSHGHIFEAVCSLWSAGEPVDPVTVAEELKQAGLLDAVGGSAVLLTIQSRTPAVSNAGHYARIVEENSLLRKLIGAGGEIAEMGFAPLDEVTKTIDAAEALVYDIGQHRFSDSMVELRQLLGGTLDHLEALYERNESITGTPSGYNELDELLSGFQRNALIILGSRPAMGKTSFALGAAAHAAIKAQRPVIFFSLEMGHLELTQRLLGAEGRVDATRLRNGSLNEQDWSKITKAMGRLAEAPLWIDDNPNMTVMEIRSKARRLKSRIGDLGLIVVDYLQLMSGRSSAENRQVEVAEISRGLKILARELETPVLALSQLSRNLEQRADKRPMLSDLRESGCLVAETKVLRADTNTETTIGELAESGERDVPVWTLDEHWRMVPSTMTRAFPSGVKETFELRLRSGRTVTASPNHPFRTVLGWRRLDELEIGSRIAVPRWIGDPETRTSMPRHEIVLLAHLLGDGCVLPGQPVHYTSADPANLDAVEEAASHFGVTPRRVPQGDWWHSYLPSPHHLTHGRHNPISSWWDGLGLRDHRSWQRFVPDKVFGLPREDSALFLHHLWATDGSLTMGTLKGRQVVRIHYATTSRRLADDIRRLLLRFEIQSHLTVVDESRGRTGYQLRVTGTPDQLRFLTLVGVHGKRGDVTREAIEVLESRSANPNDDTIPHEVRTVVVKELERTGVTRRQLATALGEQYCGSYQLGSANHPRSSSRWRIEAIAKVVECKSLAELATSDVFWDEVVGIEPRGCQPVFDATVLGTHNFVADGVIVHNSLEQDADVVMFLYRDEVYSPDTVDKGTAEIIVAKHRNGPNGVCRLAFLDYCTMFANMARG